ncbi:MAG: NifB/NifX family molybdenum-iron cluster-binding protein [Methanomassiliicoccales archaeon]|nr:NifB/NifX family molybdenum-iron cluster-binding protein [Methanomassiliicoccales archaeon]
MKVLLTSEGKTLDAMLDEEFGHCAYFIVIDPDTMQFEAVRNEGHDAEVGAGIYAAETAIKLGVEVVITGWVGPHGQRKLASKNIRIIMDEEGTVREAIERFKRKNANR